MEFLIPFMLLALSGLSLPDMHLAADLVTTRHMYQAEYRTGELSHATASDVVNMAHCAASAPDGFLPFQSGAGALLSSGDLVAIHVEQDEFLNDSYVISREGYLQLPFLPPIRALGRLNGDVERDLATALVAEGFYATPPRVSVRVTDLAEAQVFVSGAVFNAGSYVVGRQSADDRDITRQSVIGAAGFQRVLSRALASAGGIRPDADLSRVMLLRDGETSILDLRSAIVGRAFDDIPLVAGDEIIVPSRGCFQADLMVPSAITTPGVKVFMSNLTEPASSNAQSNIGKDARELVYGTRFLQAVVGMNCAGGVKGHNANRVVALFSHNPITGESILVEWMFEELVRRADRDEFNPYLLPGDSLFCYGGRYTNMGQG